MAATQCAATDIKIAEGDLRWYASSDTAERGFCGQCGSNLFWRQHNSPTISIWAGSLDGETDLTLVHQIHVDTKGDYYELPDAEIIDQEQLRNFSHNYN